MKPEYLRPGFDFALAHAVEEAGEFLAAAGKTQRWGRESYNPELPPEQREINQDWLMREMNDLEGAFQRLWRAIGQRPTVERTIAEIIHAAMVWAAQQGGQPQAWQNGNSLAEGRAREAARAVLEIPR